MFLFWFVESTCMLMNHLVSETKIERLLRNRKVNSAVTQTQSLFSTYLFSDWGRKGLESWWSSHFLFPRPHFLLSTTLQLQMLIGWTIIHWIPLSFSSGAQHVEMDLILAQLLKFSAGKAKSRLDMVRKGMTWDEGREGPGEERVGRGVEAWWISLPQIVAFLVL